MNHLIHIELDRLEGSLMRVLGLVERRGFHIDAAELYDLGEKRGLSLTIRPRDPSRNTDTLGLQIDRLYGITRLDADPRTGGKAAKPAASSKHKVGA
jgi:acetolactate synthase-1/3 small subunit